MPHLQRLLTVPLCGALLLVASCTRVERRGALAAIAKGTPEIAAIAAVVVDREGERRAEATGEAQIGARAMTVDSPVRVASVSKVVVALGVLRLVEEGKLDLDRDVSAYLGWRLRNPAHPDAPVTLRQMLGHRSSLVDDGGYFFPLGASLRDSLSAKSWHTAAPGGVWGYANINYGLTAQVMEKVTGERFDRLIRRLVLAPLKLDAGFNWSGVSPAQMARAAAVYRKSSDEDRWVQSESWVPQIDASVPPPCLVRLPAPDAPCDLDSYRPGTNGSLFSPQGGLRISARDLGRIARLILRGGELDGVRLLKPESVALLTTPTWRLGDTPSGENYNGLMRCWTLALQCLAGGPDQPLARPVAWVGHMGEAYGLYSGLWIDPQAGRGYAYVTTGTAADPALHPGKRSAFRGFEEAILEALAGTG